MKKQTQYVDHAWGFAAQQKFGPAISEAAEPSRCDAESGLPTPYLSLVGGAASLVSVQPSRAFVPLRENAPLECK